MGTVRTSAGPVSVAFDGSKSAATTVVLAHGAGGSLRSEFMEVIASGLAAKGAHVCRFNFPYMEAGKKRPDTQAVLEASFGEVIEELSGEIGDHLVLGGKSLGGRIASHVAADRPDVDALVFLGYPLHPPGRPDRIRDAHLKDLSIPMLFVEGTRDPFCPLETLERVRRKLNAPTEVAVIDDGDHSLKVRKSSGRSTQEAWQEAIAAVSGWLERLGG